MGRHRRDEKEGMGEKKQNLLFVFYFDFFFVVDLAPFSLPYVKQWSPAEGHSCLQKSGYCFTISFHHIWLVSRS